MCKTSLFYINNPLHYGPPTNTCLTKMIDYINKDALPIGTFSIIVGLQCLFLYLFHWGMFQRPLPDNENDESYQNQFANKLGMAKLDPDRHKSRRSEVNGI